VGVLSAIFKGTRWMKSTVGNNFNKRAKLYAVNIMLSDFNKIIL